MQYIITIKSKNETEPTTFVVDADSELEAFHKAEDLLKTR